MPMWGSASGYPGIEATPLARHEYSDIIMSRVYEDDWLYRITSAELLEPVTRCAQSIQIMQAPEVGPMRSYVKNQQLVPSTVGTEARCLTICNMAYQDIKFDSSDIKMACDRWAPFETKLLESLYQSYVEHQRSYVLSGMMAQVSPATSGSSAGQYGDLNLGKAGAPVHITPKNLPKVLFDLQRAFLESRRWVDGQMFLIVPPILRTYIAMSNYGNSEWSCNCGTIVTGMWDKSLAGFTTIETLHTPVYQEADGSYGFYIIAGNKEATAYASNIIDARLNTTDANSFSVRYQFLVAYGMEVIYPDAIAVGYWVFDPITE